jgi:hypothetical protein
MFGSRERQKGRLLRTGPKSILVVGSRTKRVRSLERLLAEHPCQVEVASNPKDVFNRNKEEDVDFVIMTESLNHKVDEDLFARVRVLFPRARQLVKARDYAADIRNTMHEPSGVVDPDAGIRTVNHTTLCLLEREDNAGVQITREEAKK